MSPALCRRDKATAFAAIVAVIVSARAVAVFADRSDDARHVIPPDYRQRESRLKSQVMAYNFVGLLYPFDVNGTVVAMTVGVLVLAAVLLAVCACRYFDRRLGAECEHCSECHECGGTSTPSG